jgi:hypothetical protein
MMQRTKTRAEVTVATVEAAAHIHRHHKHHRKPVQDPALPEETQRVHERIRQLEREIAELSKIHGLPRNHVKGNGQGAKIMPAGALLAPPPASPPPQSLAEVSAVGMMNTATAMNRFENNLDVFSRTWTKQATPNGKIFWTNNLNGEVSWTDPMGKSHATINAMAASHAAAHFRKKQQEEQNKHGYHCINQTCSLMFILCCPFCFVCCMILDKKKTHTLTDAVHSMTDKRKQAEHVHWRTALEKQGHLVLECCCLPCRCLAMVLGST